MRSFPTKVFPIALAAMIPLGNMCTRASAQASDAADRLYGVQAIPLGPGLSSLPHLIVIEPVSGTVEVVGRIRPTTIPSVPLALTYSNSRLFVVAIGLDELEEIQPANGDARAIGAVSCCGTGFWSIEVHPVTGVAYFLHSKPIFPNLTSTLYKLDLTTAQKTLVGRISPFTYLLRLWFEPDGQAYALNSFNHVFRLDVANATIKLIGALPFPNLVWDVAVDSKGRTLLGVKGGTPIYPTTTLYEFDVGSMTVNKLSVLEGNMFGLSFVPDLRGTTYCSGKPNSAGCVPTIHSNGFPSEPARNGFDIWATNVVNRQRGALLFSVKGAASTPFKGGTLCLMPPFSITPAIDSGGSPLPVHDCSGVWFLDFNKLNYLAPGTVPSPSHVPPGTTVSCQWLGRDRGLAAPNSVSLSDGLRFVMQP